MHQTSNQLRQYGYQQIKTQLLQYKHNKLQNDKLADIFFNISMIVVEECGNHSNRVNSIRKQKCKLSFAFKKRIFCRIDQQRKSPPVHSQGDQGQIKF